MPVPLWLMVGVALADREKGNVSARELFSRLTHAAPPCAGARKEKRHDNHERQTS